MLMASASDDRVTFTGAYTQIATQGNLDEATNTSLGLGAESEKFLQFIRGHSQNHDAAPNLELKTASDGDKSEESAILAPDLIITAQRGLMR